MPTGNIDLSMLSFLIGSWKTGGNTIVSNSDEKSIEINGTDSYEWILDKKFILHRADVKMGDQGVQVLELIGVDLKANNFILHSFDNQGENVIMNGCLNVQGQFEIKNDQMRANLSVSDSNETMEAHWEKSDKGQWISWMKIKFVRA